MSGKVNGLHLDRVVQRMKFHLDNYVPLLNALLP